MAICQPVNERTLTMTLLSHSPSRTENRFRQAPQSLRKQVAAVATDAHWATIKRFCVVALTILLAGGAVAGILALKTTVDLSHLNY